MPELPEVHTTVEGLKKTVIGKTITEVWSDFHIGTSHGSRNNLKNKNHYKYFKKLVVGAEIKSIGRKGKNILINLSNLYTIVVHMKMTGHLMYGATDKFVHLIFKLKNSWNSSGQAAKDLVLSDMRKFASVCIVETDKLSEHKGLKELGTDALKISLSEFIEKIRQKKNSPIKSALLDQKALAGIGNIYSDEILFEVGIHPTSNSDKIPDMKLLLMHKAMQKILRFSISKGGDSKSDYRNAFGEKGDFQDFHKAYGRKGEKCPKTRCGGIIERRMVRGRSAHFCPHHQKLYK